MTIHAIQITAPTPGIGYLIVDGAGARVVDIDGLPVAAAEYHVTDTMPAVPEWYVETPMPEPAPVATVRHITKLAFRNRFTTAEKTALELAAPHNPSLAVNHQSNLLAASLRASFADQRDATHIDIDRADTRAGVQALEQYGLIAAGRAAQILDTDPQPHEVYLP